MSTDPMVAELWESDADYGQIYLTLPNLLLLCVPVCQVSWNPYRIIFAIVLMLVYVCWWSVAHESVSATGAKLKLKAIGADEQDVEIAYTYSITFVVRLHCWLILST